MQAIFRKIILLTKLFIFSSVHFPICSLAVSVCVFLGVPLCYEQCILCTSLLPFFMVKLTGYL